MDQVRYLYNSWRDWPNLPDEWEPADPRSEVRVAVLDGRTLAMLRQSLAGSWKKVYLAGADGSSLHYFRHAGGKIALPKLVKRR